MSIIDLRPLHRRALRLVTSVVEQVSPSDSTRPTPCAPWDLRALLAHMIGQNHGFAAAVEAAGRSDGDVPLEAFAPREPAGDPAAAWSTSADRIAAAFAQCDLERRVLLPEVSTEHRFPAATVIGFHLLDTVVHGWDLATALDLDYRPDEELVAATLELAERVPAGPARERPGASFAPVLPVADGTDQWSRALALLGRGAA